MYCAQVPNLFACHMKQQQTLLGNFCHKVSIVQHILTWTICIIYFSSAALKECPSSSDLRHFIQSRASRCLLLHSTSSFDSTTGWLLYLTGSFNLTLWGRGLLYLFDVKFVLTRTAQYVVNMLKLWCHYASLGKFYNLNV